MSPQLDLLLVRLWTLDAARIRTSIRAVGLTVRMTRVDFPAALFAALVRRTYGAVVYDPTTPAVTQEVLLGALREHSVTSPIIVLDDLQDVGKQLAAQLLVRN